MKHAILMMAHNNEEVVKTAFRMLDDPRFVLILLLDKKAKRDASEFLPDIKKAKVVVLPQMTLNWGGFSITQGMLELIKTAVREDVDIVHYLQGADLPIKTPNEIDAFFADKRGKNFLMMWPEKNEFARYKVLCWHPFTNSRWYRTNKILKGIRYVVERIQRPFINKKEEFYHASALFSITKEFAAFIASKESFIRKRYNNGLAVDEVFVPTLLMTSNFRDTLANDKGTHFIDWNRRDGNSPRTFTMEDTDVLKDAIQTTDYIFARKFSQYKDMEIVKEVEKMVSEKIK